MLINLFPSTPFRWIYLRQIDQIGHSRQTDGIRIAITWYCVWLEQGTILHAQSFIVYSLGFPAKWRHLIWVAAGYEQECFVHSGASRNRYCDVKTKSKPSVKSFLWYFGCFLSLFSFFVLYFSGISTQISLCTNRKCA